MKQYSIEILPSAEEDIRTYIRYIIQKSLPLTAIRHQEDLYKTISRLSNYTESIRVSDKEGVLRFDTSARAVLFKKMAIIYTVHNNRVVVRAVMPASLIKK